MSVFNGQWSIIDGQWSKAKGNMIVVFHKPTVTIHSDSKIVDYCDSCQRSGTESLPEGLHPRAPPQILNLCALQTLISQLALFNSTMYALKPFNPQSSQKTQNQHAQFCLLVQRPGRRNGSCAWGPATRPSPRPRRRVCPRRIPQILDGLFVRFEKAMFDIS